MCVDYGVDIIINIKCAKLFIDSIAYYYDKFKLIGDCDMKETEKIKISNENSSIESESESSNSDIDELEYLNNFNNKLIFSKNTNKLNNVINVSQFNRNNLRSLFKNASILKQKIKNHGKLDLLKGKIVGLYFDEPSSRTYGSFYVAVKKLGGDVLPLNNNNSSTMKGESLYDTLKCIESYCDLVVVRTKEKNSLIDLQNSIKIPIINAGDGAGQHPTQALLDVFTMREEKGTVNKLNISIVGDLKYSRTVHSLVRLLSNYDVIFNFVSTEQLSLDENTLYFLKQRNISYNVYKSINEVIENTDILYMTRIQKERFNGELLDINFIEKNLYLRQDNLTNAKDNMAIMHPLPRNEEIDINIDKDPRAAYFRQMENGLYVRMALMMLLI